MFLMCFLPKPSWKWRGRGFVGQALNESRPKPKYVWEHVLIKMGWIKSSKIHYIDYKM